MIRNKTTRFIKKIFTTTITFIGLNGYNIMYSILSMFL